jgi:hypothetical protein
MDTAFSSIQASCTRCNTYNNDLDVWLLCSRQVLHALEHTSGGGDGDGRIMHECRRICAMEMHEAIHVMCT